MGKVTLVPNLSYLFCAGTIGAHRGARDNTLAPVFLRRWFQPAVELELTSRQMLVPQDLLTSPLTWPPS